MIDINSTYEGLTFDHVVGMQNEVEFLKSLEVIPQTGIFQGPVGCGKNLLAYLLSQRLPNVEISVRDSADNTAAAALNLIKEFSASPFLPEQHQVCIINEMHMFRPRDAQRKFVDILQSPPERTYLFACTVEPERIIKDVYSRFRFVIEVRPLTPTEAYELTHRCFNELPKKQKQLIAANSKGIPRTIINTIETLRSLNKVTDELILSTIKKQPEDESTKYFNIIYSYIEKGNANLRPQEVVALLNKVGMDPESVRFKILHLTKKNFRSTRSHNIIKKFLKELEPGAEEFDLLLRVNEIIGR